MKEVFEKYSICDRIILICFGVFVAFGLFQQSCVLPLLQVNKPIVKYLKYTINIIFYLIFFIDFFVDFFTKKRRLNIWIWLFSIIAVLSFIPNQSITFVVLVLVLIEMSKYNFTDLVKVVCFSVTVTYVLIIVFSCFDIIPNLKYNRSEGDLSRNSLGFSYPTVLSTTFFYLLLMRYFLKNFKLGYYELIIDLLISCLVYALTDSRMGFFLCLIVILFGLCVKLPAFNKINFDKFFQHTISKIILVSVPVLFLFIWIGLVFMYHNGMGFALKINELLSGRLYLSCKAFYDNRITLLGSDMKMHGWGGVGYWVTEAFEYNYLDNSYMYILFVNGIVPLIVTLLLYMWIIFNAINTKNYLLLFCIFLALIDSMVDTYITNFVVNFVILSAVPLFYKTGIKSTKKEKILN